MCLELQNPAVGEPGANAQYRKRVHDLVTGIFDWDLPQIVASLDNNGNVVGSRNPFILDIVQLHTRVTQERSLSLMERTRGQLGVHRIRIYRQKKVQKTGSHIEIRGVDQSVVDENDGQILLHDDADRL